MTTTETATAAIQKAPRQPLAFLPSNLDDAWRISEMLSKSGILPDALKGRPHDILVTIMTGTELGLSPMAAIRDIYVVKGKGYMSALLKIALVKQSPECEFFRCVETNDQHAIFETKRKGEGITRFEYTIQDAQRADLVGKSKKADAGKDNWEKNPKLMMRRRCGSELCDEVYSDIVRGIGNRDDVQPESVAVNAAPSTFAPPAPEMEDAQVVSPTPPPAPQSTANSEAKRAFDGAKGTAEPTVAGEMANQIDQHMGRLEPKTEPARQREPGDDDDAPLQPPVSMMSKPQAELPIEENDLAVYAQVKALCDDPATTEAQLDVLSPKAQRIKGPMRKDISDLFIAKRKALRDAKAKAGGK